MNPNARVFDFAKWEAKVDRIVEKRFTAYFMSNAKWRKLFTILHKPELGIEQLLWKYVDDELVTRHPLPYFTFRRQLFSGPGGEDYLKRIEWVEIPRLHIPPRWKQIPFKHRPQDVERAVKLLNMAGKFELERTNEGVRIYGYRKPCRREAAFMARI